MRLRLFFNFALAAGLASGCTAGINTNGSGSVTDGKANPAGSGTGESQQNPPQEIPVTDQTMVLGTAGNMRLLSFDVGVVSESEKVRIRLHDANGNPVRSADYAHTDKLEMDVSDLVDGEYFVELSVVDSATDTIKRFFKKGLSIQGGNPAGKNPDAAVQPPPPAPVPTPDPAPVDGPKAQFVETVLSGDDAVYGVIKDPLVNFAYVLNAAGIHAIDLATGDASPLPPTWADGPDDPSRFVFLTTARQFVHKCQVASAIYKLCRSFASSAGGRIDSTEVISDINADADDRIADIEADQVRGLVYVTARTAGGGGLVFRVDSSFTSASKLSAANSLMAGGHANVNVRIHAVMQTSGNVYIHANGIHGGSFWQTMRITSAVTTASPLSLSYANRLSYTRTHTNQYINIVHVDQLREYMYYKSTTTFSGQLFRLTEARDQTTPITQADRLEDLVSSGTNSFAKLQADDTNDVLYISAMTGSPAQRKLFRVSSAVTNASPLVTQLSNTNAAGDDGFGSSCYDSVTRHLYFAATTGTSKKLFRIADTSDAAVTSGMALTDTAPSADDLVSSLVCPGDNRIWFVAADDSGYKKIFHLKQADQAAGPVSSAHTMRSNLNPAGSDEPVLLSHSVDQDLVYFSYISGEGYTRLLALPAKGDVAAGDFADYSLVINAASDDGVSMVRPVDSKKSIVNAKNASGSAKIFLLIHP